MHVVMRPGVPVLGELVDSFWYYDGQFAAGRERVLPNGDMSLMVNLHEDELRTYSGGAGGPVLRVGGAALQGPHSGPVVIDAADQRRIAGVSFRPGGAYPFFATPASEVSGGLVGLDELWGRDGAVLRDRLLSARTPAGVLRSLEAVLLSRLVRPARADPAVVYAVRALECGAGVLRVADRLGLSRRRLASRFSEHVGLTPKLFARVRRFQRVLGCVVPSDGVDWARLAVEHGFYDQAHLINDFRDLSGLRPTEYRPRSAGERNHVPISPIPAAEEGSIMGP